MPEMGGDDNSPPINLKKEQELMKKLLEVIMSYFEEETQKVDAGTLKEEGTLLSPYVQENDPDTQHHIRPVLENFKRAELK